MFKSSGEAFPVSRPIAGGQSTRRIRWLSAKFGNREALLQLQQRLIEFYRKSSGYYDAISFAYGSWRAEDEAVHRDILEIARSSERILEIGCGAAAMLSAEPELAPKYTGVDFSSVLLAQNRARYPGTKFCPLSDPLHLPFKDGSFDLVFSIFVIEHTVFPNKFLAENVRVVAGGGIICILCPDFLESGRMISQRAGFSPGTGKEKLKRGQFLDAVVTWWDNRARIPLTCFWRSLLSRLEPQFWINVNPVCFTDPFIPDVDAVYIASRHEIMRETRSQVSWEVLPKAISDFCRERKLIYLRGRRLR